MNERIIISADELAEQELLALASSIGERVYAIKIHDAYDRLGPGIVGELKDAGAHKVWMDAKIHDIPNTARARAKAFAENGIDIITVHASGGVEMMRAAKEGAGSAEVYAVTVLTSLSEEAASTIYHQKVMEQVLALAHLAKEAEVDGVVCSAKEVAMLAADPALTGLKFVVPGVRSPGADTHDQKRVMTPREAINAGATHLVIGRQVTTAQDPASALSAVESELL
ncbi:MAG TPA: orotidine-5'-phosphate decarboxylase [Candidatus Paceibacterota bacterium]|nr:orotidine-5'-phosphate decarboxylase [Candidatus Paceibacterota bacterium]